MGGAEWNGAVALLGAWLTHQPAPMPVVVLLAAAFSLVMFIEGLRANFLPGRYTTRSENRACGQKPGKQGIEFRAAIRTDRHVLWILVARDLALRPQTANRIATRLWRAAAGRLSQN